MKSSGLVEEVYLVRFEKIILGGGGVQYQQTSNQSNTAGWFDFVSVTMETSATALLDIQNAPNVRPFLQPYMLSLLNHCSQIAQF